MHVMLMEYLLLLRFGPSGRGDLVQFQRKMVCVGFGKLGALVHLSGGAWVPHACHRYLRGMLGRMYLCENPNVGESFMLEKDSTHMVFESG